MSSTPIECDWGCSVHLMRGLTVCSAPSTDCDWSCCVHLMRGLTVCSAASLQIVTGDALSI